MMPYQLSLGDLPQNNSYNLSLADLPPVVAPANQGVIGSAASTLAPISAGANEFAGGSLSGLGSMLSKARSTFGVTAPQLPGVPQASLSLGNYNPGQALQNVGNAVTANAPTNYNGVQPTLTQQAVEGAAHYAPYVPGALDAAATGATNIAKWLTGGLQDEAAVGAYGQLSNGLSKDDLNKSNTVAALNNLQTQLDNSKTAYANFGSNVADRGYATSGSPGYAEMSGNTVGKFINPQATTNTVLDKAAVDMPNSKVAPLYNNLSGDTQGMINAYNNSPTFNNAHALQSQLGKESANIRAGLNKNIPDASQATTLENARDALQNDIHSTFNANGDTDLSTQYTKLGEDYKNNVVPSMNVTPIWRAFNQPKAKFPTNIANELSQGDAEGYRQTILNQLSQNPQTANNIVAQAIPKVGQLDSVGKSTTTADNLLTGYANLPAPIKNIMPQQTNSLLQQLQNSVRTRQNLFKAANVAKGIGYGAAGLAGAIYGAKKLVE